jgi:hypothetical protein
LEQAAEAVLHAAMELGETMVVTNGNEFWVQESTRLFLPRLQPTLNRLKVISARASYERRYPNEPFAWKRHAFKDLLVQRRGGSPIVGNPFLASCGAAVKTEGVTGGARKSGVNLVVLGDSRAEMEAAEHSLRFIGRQSLVKTVKFKEVPTVNELLGQLRRVHRELESIVREDRHGSRNLVQCPFPANVGQLASWAAGWKLTENQASWRAAAGRSPKLTPTARGEMSVDSPAVVEVR